MKLSFHISAQSGIMLVLLSCLFLAACQSDPVSTTGSITGTVYDFQTSKALPGAQVTVVSLGRSTTTNQNGNYSFKDVEAGTYRVQASKDGYQTDNHDVVVSVDEEHATDFHLRPSVSELTLDKDVLDFGSESSTMTFDILNTGFADMQWQVSVSKDAQWLQCQPTSGTTHPGQRSSVTVHVNRSLLRLGSFTENIAVTTDGGGSHVVRVNVRVAGVSQAPTVETGAATNISATSITVGGIIVDMGTENGITQHGHLWSTNTEEPNLTSAQGVTRHGTLQRATSYSSTFTGLQPNTTYYIRAYATNVFGTSYGQVVRVSTPYDNLQLSTKPVTAITHNAATCGGTITYLGGHNVVERGVCWGEAANPSTAGKHVAATEQGQEFSVRLTGLTKLTSYHARAYSVTATGQTFYGQDVPFSTTYEILPPELSGVQVNAVTFRSATLSAAVTELNYGHLSDAGFVWSTTSQPTTAHSKLSVGTKTSLQGRIGPLAPNTTYYVRAYATNEAGTAYGSVVSFTTSEQPEGTDIQLGDFDGNEQTWD